MEKTGNRLILPLKFLNSIQAPEYACRISLIPQDSGFPFQKNRELLARQPGKLPGDDCGEHASFRGSCTCHASDRPLGTGSTGRNFFKHNWNKVCIKSSVDIFQTASNQECRQAELNIPEILERSESRKTQYECDGKDIVLDFNTGKRHRTEYKIIKVKK